MERPAKIVVRNLCKVFHARGRRVTALEDVSFVVPDGTFLAIVGPSGCGKTTLLRILAGLEEASSGQVTVHRSDPARPVNSMVFQEQSVLPWMTVRENVAYGLRLRGVDREARHRIAEHYIQLVGLSGFSEAYPHQLSGGMKQRVSIARAFANDPEILLMDEPFANLDEQNKILLQQELLRIWEGTQKTVCYITHSIDEALNLSDRVMIITARPGRVKAVIDVDLGRPRDIARLRSHPRFGELFGTIWQALREEVVKATVQEGVTVA